MNPAQHIMSIFGPGGWVESGPGNAVFNSVPAARWVLDDEMRARVIEKDPRVFFYKGRELMTADPQALLAAVIAVMQEDAAAKLTVVRDSGFPPPVRHTRKATVSPLSGRKGRQSTEPA